MSTRQFVAMMACYVSAMFFIAVSHSIEMTIFMAAGIIIASRDPK
jgi:hypothetical protein